MSILYGTDFSSTANAGIRVAAALAEKMKEQLILIHVLPDPVPGLERADQQEDADARRQIEELAKGAGGKVSARVERGSPDVVLPRLTRETSTSLVVVSARSKASRWLLGSTADRIASTTEVPLLVLREEFAADEWLSGKRPLEVAIASDLSVVSDLAYEWAASLAKLGPCRFTIVHVAWPSETYHRLGIDGPMIPDHTHPAMERFVARELDLAKERIGSSGPCEIVIESAAKKPAEALARFANRAKVDLLVVGHLPSRLWRAWEGSVARAVIRSSPISVAAVPHIKAMPAVRSKPLMNIVAATDLSAGGNRAVAHAISIVPPDGTVTILHVVEEGELTPEERARIVEGLEGLIVDQRLTECRVEVKFEIVASSEPAEAIERVATEIGADLLCISARGRSHLPRILLGSVAQELLLSSQIPVLLSPG